LRFWLPTKCVVIAAGVITIPGEDTDLMTLETPFPILYSPSGLDTAGKAVSSM
jgi:hypothetical protein